MTKTLQKTAIISRACYEKLEAFYEAFGLKRDHELDSRLAEVEQALETTADRKALQAARKVRAGVKV